MFELNLNFRILVKWFLKMVNVRTHTSSVVFRMNKFTFEKYYGMEENSNRLFCSIAGSCRNSNSRRVR